MSEVEIFAHATKHSPAANGSGLTASMAALAVDGLASTSADWSAALPAWFEVTFGVFVGANEYSIVGNPAAWSLYAGVAVVDSREFTTLTSGSPELARERRFSLVPAAFRAFKLVVGSTAGSAALMLKEFSVYYALPCSQNRPSASVRLLSSRKRTVTCNALYVTFTINTLYNVV